MVKNDMWYIYILLFFRILALENIAKILTTGPRLTHACLSATCVHAWIKEFSPAWWAVRAQLVEKSPDNFLVLNLFYSGGPMFISKKVQFFPESKQGDGVKNVKRSNLFQGDGAQLLFCIELVVFQVVPDSMFPLWIRALPMYTCLCLWHFKVTKKKRSTTRSKFFNGICV